MKKRVLDEFIGDFNTINKFNSLTERQKDNIRNKYNSLKKRGVPAEQVRKQTKKAIMEYCPRGELVSFCEISKKLGIPVHEVRRLYEAGMRKIKRGFIAMDIEFGDFKEYVL